MSPEEERQALAEKTEELARTIAETDRRLTSLPRTPQTAEAREAMGKLLGEMHRMEENMRRLLSLCKDEDLKEDRKMAVIDNLKVTQEEMQNAIQTFENKKMALENAYLKISNEVRTLDGTYHGEASEKFKAQFDALYKNLQQNEVVMGNVIANLKQALNIYTEEEEAARSMIEGLDVGTAYQNNL